MWRSAFFVSCGQLACSYDAGGKRHPTATIHVGDDRVHKREERLEMRREEGGGRMSDDNELLGTVGV